MRKTGSKDFQLSLQEAQFQEDHKFRQKKSDNCVLFSHELLIQHGQCILGSFDLKNADLMWSR